MTKAVTLIATERGTYDRVVIDGHIYPFTTYATLARGDTLEVTVPDGATWPPQNVVWWEQGKPMPAAAVVDIYARQLAERRPAD